LDYLLEIILKVNQLGNSLEELKIIKFNQMEDIEKIYSETNKKSSNEVIKKYPFILENVKNNLKLQKNSSLIAGE